MLEDNLFSDSKKIGYLQDLLEEIENEAEQSDDNQLFRSLTDELLGTMHPVHRQIVQSDLEHISATWPKRSDHTRLSSHCMMLVWARYHFDKHGKRLQPDCPFVVPPKVGDALLRSSGKPTFIVACDACNYRILCTDEDADLFLSDCPICGHSRDEQPEPDYQSAPQPEPYGQRSQ